MSGLPRGWTSTTLESLVGFDGLFSDGDWVESKDQDPSGAIRLLQLADVGDGKFLNKSRRFLNDEQFKRLRCTEVLAGDVLIARMPDPLGRACIVPSLNQRCVTVVDVAIVRPDTASANPRWLMHFLNSQWIRQTIESEASGTTRRRISRGKLAKLQLPLPPLPEQKRIADKLDALLARVDACRERLDRVPAILKRFRQSVLAAATTGELTREWREDRGLSLDDWRVVELKEICESIADGDHQAPPKSNCGIPFITISAINSGQLRLDQATRFVPESYFQSLRPERRARLGDVLYSVTGSIGIAALVETGEPFVFQRHIAVLRPRSGATTGRFLRYRLMADDIKQQAEAVATGTAQLTIPLGGLRSFSFGLPTIEEQEEIARHIDNAFALIAVAEAAVERGQTMVSTLVPATLAKAFRGELAPQDPNDEPAAALLARIAAQRDHAPPAARGRGRVATGKRP